MNKNKLNESFFKSNVKESEEKKRIWALTVIYSPQTYLGFIFVNITQT